MSDKKHQKSIEELCRSRISRTAGGEKWPSLSEKSSHNIMPRSPSPMESYSRIRRCPDATTRHSLLSGRPLSTDLRTCPKQSVHEAAVEKQKVYSGVQEPVKKTFFPGISPQVVTHADHILRFPQQIRNRYLQLIFPKLRTRICAKYFRTRSVQM